jgi:FG-GAP-like repeat
MARTMRALGAWMLLAAMMTAQAPLFGVVDNPIPYGAGTIEAAGDLDGDGDADLLCANGVLVNDGGGRFSHAGNPLPFFRSRAILADLNGDGLQDLISLTGVVRIDINLGGLVFSGPIAGLPASPTGYTVDLAAGDMDGDGDVDLFVTTGIISYTPGIPVVVPGPVVLWANDLAVSGAFAPVPTFPGLTGSPVLRDLDGDSDLDVVVGSSIVVNAGAGTFTVTPAPWTWLRDFGDLNGDGLPDAVSVTTPPTGGSTIELFLNSAGGFLPPVGTLVSQAVWRIAAVDLTGDGTDDLVVDTYYGDVRVFLTGPGATLTPTTQSWFDLDLREPVAAELVLDLDGDGDRDVLAIGWTEPAALMNAGNGSLVRLGGHVDGFAAVSDQQVGDVDADGDLDLVGFTNLNTIGTALNDGDGNFTSGPGIPFPGPGSGYAYQLTLFDGDGDGDQDLYVCRNVGGGNMAGAVDYLYQNAGGGAFVLVATLLGTGGSAGVRVADLDADGDQDLLSARRDLPQFGNFGPMVALLNLGAAGLSAPVPVGTPHQTFDLDLGDFDGNGFVDAFQTNRVVYAPDACVLYLNTGTTYLAVPQPGLTGTFTAAGDLNGDGLADLVVDGQVHFSAGAGALVAGPLLSTPLVAPAELADVDLDGDLDLVETPGTVMRNAGGGVFGPPESYLPRAVTPTSWFELPEAVVADVDRDGDADLVTIGQPYLGYWIPGPLVVSNLTRQLARGAVPRPGRPASLDLHGTAGSAWQLWASTGTAAIPLSPFGTVLIDPALAVLFASGSFAPATSPVPGTATLSATVPNSPALIGWTTYWQTVDLTAPSISNRRAVTVLGY